MENELDTLKNIFSHSSENVFIMNYEFEILWHNKTELLNFFSGTTFKELLGKENRILESGEYFFTYNGLEFSGRIINYKEQQLYVLQMSGDDVMYASIKSGAVREFFINQAAQVRQAVTGISFAANMLRKTLDEAGIHDREKLLDITAGNCYKLLKSVLNTTELIRYTEDTSETVKIDLTDALTEFAEICRRILKGQIDIVLKAAPELYIKADTERLTACLLSLTVLTGRHNPGCSVIMLDAERVGGNVSVTASAKREGEKTGKKVFSEFERLYENETADSDLFVVCRFCRRFGGTVFIADAPETGGKIYSLKFPSCNDSGGTTKFSSSVRSYHENKFSKYHIALSDIAEIY